MIAAVLAVLDSLILISAGILHVYWSRGGQWGFAQALPTRPKDPNDEIATRRPAFRPPGFAIRMVGLACFVGAGLLLARSGVITVPIAPSFIATACWVMAGLFLLRTIGDFRYAGLFRRIKDSSFAYWDARLFTPLFFFLGVTTILINLLAE